MTPGGWIQTASRQAQRVESELLRELRAAAHCCLLAERKVGLPLRARPMPGTKRGDEIAFTLHDESGRARAIAQLSSTTEPDRVARGVARADVIAEALDPDAAAAILAPFTTGVFDGASFAIWPFRRRVPNRTFDFIVRRAFERPVLRWLRELARQTARPLAPEAIGERVYRPLHIMATREGLSPHASLAARTALERLESGRWHPMQVAMHGDLHTGNVLIDDGDATGREGQLWRQCFTVIGWCDASLSGRPLVDLIRIAESMRIPRAVLARELAAHCALLGSGAEDAAAHAAAALAHLGVELGGSTALARQRALADKVLGQLELRSNGARALQ